jgi:type VI protein secretion system component Hcp
MRRSTWGAAVVAIGAAARADAAVDVFVCIEGVTGSSCTSDVAHQRPEWVAVSSWSYGVTNDPSGGSPGADALPLEIQLPLTALTPPLLIGALDGTTFPTLHVAQRRAGAAAGSSKFYSYLHFTDAVVTSSRLALQGDDPMTVLVSFRTSGAEHVYYRLRADGALLSPPTVSAWTTP